MPFVFLAALLLPSAVAAHAFGQQFTLPLPVNFYITGGLIAFISSCLIIFALGRTADDEPHRNVRSYALPAFTDPVLKILGLVLLVLSFSLALWSSSDYWINPLPNFFWVIFLLGFTYISAIIGGLWNAINPFKTIAELIIDQKKTSHRLNALLFLSPALLVGLLWLELFSGGLGAVPIVLGIVSAAYLLLSIAGSFLYGTDRWFDEYDFFTVFFNLVGRVAPITYAEGRIHISNPIQHLTAERATHMSALVFILILLGSTVLDGLRETKIWRDFLYELQSFGLPLGDYIGVVSLLVLPLILLGLYVFAVYVMGRVAHAKIPHRDLYLRFAYSLIPIALAYHFAHYFSIILSEGQRFLAQISDPFAKGWDLFGTAGRDININLVGADTVWYLQLSAIVIGHVVAALIAHQIALRVFPRKRDAILSQLPMLVLMVGYTAFGLWTLSQPFAN